MDKTYFDTMKAQMAEFKEKMKADGKKFFLEQSKELFKDNPSLVKFGWVQYTPYFNDGDACTFSAQLDSPRILIEGENEDEYEETWYRDSDNSDSANVWRKVIKFLSQFDEDDVELLFGDHCEVVVTRDTVEVEEYEHD